MRPKIARPVWPALILIAFLATARPAAPVTWLEIHRTLNQGTATRLAAATAANISRCTAALNSRDQSPSPVCSSITPRKIMVRRA